MPSSTLDQRPDIRGEAEAWLSQWEGMIRDCDFKGAEALFTEEVVGFGSYSDVMQGRAELCERQWLQIWPRTRAFAFERDRLSVTFDPEGHVVVLHGLWRSEGVGEAGEAYPRRGRATLVLARRDGRLKAVHTHFSMLSGYPALRD